MPQKQENVNNKLVSRRLKQASVLRTGLCLGVLIFEGLTVETVILCGIIQIGYISTIYLYK